MARTEPQINIRIPADLKAALDREAEASRRSLTAEIVARLQASLERPRSAWAESFPHAAAAIGSESERALEQRLRIFDLRQRRAMALGRIEALRNQLHNLDSQAVVQQTSLLQLQHDIDRAGHSGPSEHTERLIGRVRELRAMLEQMDKQRVDVDMQRLQTEQHVKEFDAELEMLTGVEQVSLPVLHRPFDIDTTLEPEHTRQASLRRAQKAAAAAAAEGVKALLAQPKARK